MAGDYNDWLRRHHAKFSTPTHLVDAVVSKTMGVPVVGRERVLRGEVNEVYLVTLANDATCIVRIAHGDSERFTRAEAMISLARAVGVPSPETLSIERIELDDDLREICIQTRMPGRPMDEIESELKDDIPRLIADAGELLARLHSVDVPEAEPEPLLRPRTAEQLTQIYDLASTFDADPSSLDRALDVINHVRDRLNPGAASLVHSDFGTKHFMVHDGQISGVLDWDGARAAHPVVDLEWWDMFYDRPPHPVENLIAGYTRVAPLPDDHEVLRAAFGLNHALGLIQYYASVENTGAAKFSVARIDHFLAKWVALADAGT